MAQPLVTIIGISYNQAAFIREALDSIRQQTYPNLQVILADDGSTDNSAALIRGYAADFPEWELLLSPANQGYTRTFNHALQKARGSYLIDFALDDVLHPEKIEAQVKAFEKLGPAYGIVHTDAVLIGQAGAELGLYSDTKKAQGWPPPSGDVFAAVLGRSFICAPTIMVRKQVLDELGGYDTTLAYEDFDLFVRVSRSWKFSYLDKPLIRRRVWQGSMSQSFYQKRRLTYFQTTLQVCQKAAGLVQTPVEKQALLVRIRFEMRQALFTENTQVLPGYLQLLQSLGAVTVTDRLLVAAGGLGLPLAGLFRAYHKWKGSRQVT